MEEPETHATLHITSVLQQRVFQFLSGVFAANCTKFAHSHFTVCTMCLPHMQEMPGAGTYAVNSNGTGKQILSQKGTLPSHKIGTGTRDAYKRVRCGVTFKGGRDGSCVSNVTWDAVASRVFLSHWHTRCIQASQEIMILSGHLMAFHA